MITIDDNKKCSRHNLPYTNDTDMTCIGCKDDIEQENCSYAVLVRNWENSQFEHNLEEISNNLYPNIEVAQKHALELFKTGDYFCTLVIEFHKCYM